MTRRILGSAGWAGFTFNGITTYGDGHDSPIGGDALSDGERDALLALCRQRLHAFRQQRGEELDHIVPRNQGGSDDLSNQQALCFRCNAAKREAGCVFCALEGSGRVLVENELALCIADAYPVTPGHCLGIPWRHVAEC